MMESSLTGRPGRGVAGAGGCCQWGEEARRKGPAKEAVSFQPELEDEA